jgi:hypothetical protein
MSMDGGPHGAGGAGPWPEGFRAAACCVITMHPFLSGRPARARALGSLIDKIIQRGEIWLAPLGEIADRVMAATPATPGPGCAKMPPGRKGRSS